ncbi:MAG: hypothetical protein HZC40_09540, partial [Chloroflexi bacterium]|nr:hypothetical protein [Chloroflexota bacterium]
MKHQSNFDHPFPAKRFVLPRLGIVAQLYFGVLVLAIALLVTEAAAWIDTEQQARAQYEQPWTTVSIADSIILCDKDGIALAQLGAHQAVALGADLRDLPGIADALAGKRVAGLIQDRAGRLLGRVTLPVYAPDTHALVGGVLLGFYLDGSFLQYRFRKLDQEIAIVHNDRLYILTLSDREGKPWGGDPAPAAVLKAQREGRMSALIALDVDFGTWFFKFKPIQLSASANSGMYGVGVSNALIDRLRLNLFRTFGIGILVIALGMGLGAFFCGRTLTN